MLPVPGQVESMLKGINGWGNFSIYEMFSGKGCSVSKGSKPFIITETGATFHLSKRISVDNSDITVDLDSGPGRLNIKQAWWQQLFNATFFKEFPKLKAISTFEFIKFEETTHRDFTTLGRIQETTGTIEEQDMTKSQRMSFLADISRLPRHALIYANSSILTTPISISKIAGSSIRPSPSLLLILVYAVIGAAVSTIL